MILRSAPPPYFNLEVYCDEPTQSYNRFTNYNDWVKKYLRVTILNCIDMLKDDGIFAVNIYEKLPKIKSIFEVICRERDFVLFDTDFMEIQVRPGIDLTRQEKKYEPIWYFKNKKFV